MQLGLLTQICYSILVYLLNTFYSWIWFTIFMPGLFFLFYIGNTITLEGLCWDTSQQESKIYKLKVIHILKWSIHRTLFKCLQIAFKRIAKCSKRIHSIRSDTMSYRGEKQKWKVSDSKLFTSSHCSSSYKGNHFENIGKRLHYIRNLDSKEKFNVCAFRSKIRSFSFDRLSMPRTIHCIVGREVF